jgi:1,4-alpha-glucan branching enzyme
VDELSAVSRLGRTGYLRALPITILELLPVTEFSTAESWGYDPAFYFGIDSFYGGAPAMARFVNAAHAAGRGVMLDMVYNHSLMSSLVVIAPEYSNGQYDGDRMNCGNPMMIEYFRQATIYLFRTYCLDGFRLDDTQTVVASGGWGFLRNIRDSLRKAATAEGRNWPYVVAENSATRAWDISNPSFGVTDGQWGIDEAYRIEDACYDLYHPGWDESRNLRSEMNNPAYWGRPFFQAVRFGESHDMVSAQAPANQRIAARPPFGFGYRMAKAMGALTLLSNGTPMLFMGQEVGETDPFSFPDNEEFINPQNREFPAGGPTDRTRILAWFRQLMGLRNDPSQGLRGNANDQVVATGNRTVAYTCGAGQKLFTVVTFGTPDQRQDSSWLGLPSGAAYKEIFNSSWPAFQVEFEQEHANGGYDARIYSGQILNLPYVGAVVLQRR